MLNIWDTKLKGFTVHVFDNDERYQQTLFIYFIKLHDLDLTKQTQVSQLTKTVLLLHNGAFL